MNIHDPMDGRRRPVCECTLTLVAHWHSVSARSLARRACAVISVCLCLGGADESRVISDAFDVISGRSGDDGSGSDERAKRALTSSLIADRRTTSLQSSSSSSSAAAAGGGGGGAEPLNVTVNWTRHAHDGSLSAIISFRLLQSVTTATATATAVKLYWRTNTCNAHRGFKYCDLPNSDNSKTYYVYYDQASFHNNSTSYSIVRSWHVVLECLHSSCLQRM